MGGFFSVFLKLHKIGVPSQVVVSQQESEDVSYTIEEVSDLPIVETTSMFTKSSNKLGLLVGINYISNESENDDLNGCVNDMCNLFDFLQKECHFRG